MRTNEKKEPVLIYDKSGQQKQTQTAPTTDAIPAQTGAAPANDATTQASAAPVATTPAAPQADPFADYMKESQRQYASTIADIRRRRQELSQRYQPSIERQKKIMKIMALGKLIGQLGQLAGGAGGVQVVDKDPYQINAWNELNRMRNEQRYYGQQLDAEERAAMNNMRTGLDKLRYENMRQNLLSKNRMAENEQRYKLMKERDMNQYALKGELETLKQNFRKEIEEAKGQRQLDAIYARGGVALQTAAAKYGYSLSLAQVNAILKNWVAAGGDVLREQGDFPDLSGYAPSAGYVGNSGGGSAGSASRGTNSNNNPDDY